ncbi:MAG: hypothetical protein KIS62_12450 [Ramlibacter sp.]|nr:hypothetical protein [Ramlibacter sp.]
MPLPWPRARALLQAVRRREAQALIDLACAVRVGGADAKDFAKWMRSMDAGAPGSG